MTLGHALMMTKLWSKKPSLIYSWGVGGQAETPPPTPKKQAYATREEVNQLVAMCGRKN